MSDSLPVVIPAAEIQVVDPAPASTPRAEELPPAQVVERLRSGAMAAGELCAELRVRCVEHMALEGFSTEEMARLLGVAERTVRRDRAAVREENAMKPGENLTAAVIGEHQRLALASIARLTRLANAPDTPAKAKLEAERMIMEHHRALIDMAERFQYMPKSADSERYWATRSDPAAFERYRENLRLQRKWDAVGKSRRELEVQKFTEGEI